MVEALNDKRFGDINQLVIDAQKYLNLLPSIDVCAELRLIRNCLKKKSCNGQMSFSYRGARIWNDRPDRTNQALPCIVSNKCLVYFCSLLFSFVILHKYTFVLD